MKRPEELFKMKFPDSGISGFSKKIFKRILSDKHPTNKHKDSELALGDSKAS
jgi:hypothetical protein